MDQNNGSKTEAAADMFDLTRLRLSQDFGASVGVKKALLTIPVRKPDRQWFIRVNPDPSVGLKRPYSRLRRTGRATLCRSLKTARV